ncbi:TPA: hypothetical protein QIY58_003480, partial [Escherichia coli]|nr:hypothetical protein [Escherichia coli]
MTILENPDANVESVYSLHPTTLFHFTKNEDAFYSILAEKYFKPFLAREEIRGVGGRRRFAVPMVSFCDIKLSQIRDHSGKYGEFGLGLTKSWAEKKGLHPVLYMNKSSEIFSKYNARIRLIKNKLVPLWKARGNLDTKNRIEFEKLKAEYSDLYNLLRYMKNYRGKLERKDNKTIENYIYADEKEWRYVPAPFIGDLWPSLSLERVITSDDKAKISSKFSKFGIDFEFNDIKYILIPKEQHIQKLINFLSGLDGFES